jgi:Zn-dependent protease
MKALPALLICALVLLAVVPATVAAGAIPDDSGLTGSLSGAFSPYPVVTVTKTPVKNPYIVTVITTPQPAGILMLSSVPSGASVAVDGSLKGTTPLTVSPITPGVHAVTFSLAGYKDYSTKVTVPTGAVGKLAVTLVPVTTVPARTTATPVPSATVLPSTGITRILPATTVTPALIRPSQQVTGAPAERCTRHTVGAGLLGTAPDGRLNCTTLISTDDGIAVLVIPEGTLVTDASGKPVPEIRISPVTGSGIPAGPLPEGSRWTGRAYRFLPDHTRFDPPVLVAFTLGQAEWDRSDPANLSIGETLESGPGWEPLATSVDPATRTVSAPVRHLSTIGLFTVGPAPVPPSSPVDWIRTATGSAPGPLPLSPLIPDKSAPLAAVAAGIALSIAGAMAGGSTVVSALRDRLTDLVRNFLGAETSGLLSATEIEKRGIRPAENLSALLLGISSREMLVIGFSALGFAAAVLLQDRLEPDLITILIFVGAGGIATILHDLAHKYGAYRTGCITEYRFWGLGTVTMLATAWLFGNAFAKPSRTLIRSGNTLTPETAAVIRLAGPLTSMAVAVVSLFLIPLGGLFVIAGSAGFTMNLLNAVFSLVPVRPNDGVEVYAWNRLIWASVFIPLMAFYLYIYLIL